MSTDHTKVLRQIPALLTAVVSIGLFPTTSCGLEKLDVAVRAIGDLKGVVKCEFTYYDEKLNKIPYDRTTPKISPPIVNVSIDGMLSITTNKKTKYVDLTAAYNSGGEFVTVLQKTYDHEEILILVNSQFVTDSVSQSQKSGHYYLQDLTLVHHILLNGGVKDIHQEAGLFQIVTVDPPRSPQISLDRAMSLWSTALLMQAIQTETPETSESKKLRDFSEKLREGILKSKEGSSLIESTKSAIVEQEKLERKRPGDGIREPGKGVPASNFERR